MGDPRKERLALNETLFRNLNEMLKKEKAVDESERPTFVCECAELNCQLKLPVSLEEYTSIRAHAARFLVFPGHEIKDVEVIVGGSPPRYAVVEKVGEGRDVAGA